MNNGKSFVSFNWLDCLLLILPLLLVTNCLEANGPLVFRSYTVKEGLSHNFVRKTILDSKGFVWIATPDGLNRFDGYTFKTYYTKIGDSTSLATSDIKSLVEDKNGNLWVSTWGGGICIYNPKLDNFHRIPIAEEGHDSTCIASRFINFLYADPQGYIWIGSSDNGLFMADPDRLIFTHYHHNPDDPNSLSNNEITSITGGGNGTLWIGTLGGGINHFDPKTGKFAHFKHQEENPQSLSSNNVFTIFYDSKKRLWVDCNNHVLHLMKDGSGEFIRLKHQPNALKGLGNYQIMAMAIGESADHKIWIGTSHGLYVFNEENNQFGHYTHKPFDPKSLSSSQIKSIYKDREGRMWVGTFNGGVNLFDSKPAKILHYYNIPNETSISANDVNAFLEYKDGSILVGTDAGGLNIFNKTTGGFTHFKRDSNNPNSIRGDFIKSILMDKKGRIWIGLWAEGIDRFDPEKQAFTHVKLKGIDETLHGNSNVTCLTEDRDGFIWASTWGAGIFKYDPRNGSVKNYTHEENNPHSLSEKRAWTILADHKNNIWIGNSDGVLNLFDRESGKFVHFDTKRPWKHFAVILAIYEDSKGRIWVGMEGSGLKLFNRDKGTFKSYTVEDGLPSNYISAIEEDQHGNLWLGTNHGIASFNPETAHIINYGLSDGLQSLQFNRMSSITLSTGEMMFGGINGFNIFHPDSLAKKPQNIPIVFTDFQVFNKPVPIGEKNSPLQSHINEMQAITLSHNQSVFSIEYAGLNYADPENTRYKYRLKGFVDENWQEAGKERKVTYTNLRPGEYTFEVALANINNQRPSRTLTITVTPPWWKTLVARLAAIIVIAGGLIAFYRLRVNGIKHQNKKLEEEVADRTSNLKKLNTELMLSEQNLKLAYDQVKITTDALNQIAFIMKGDADGRITEVNPTFLEITGYDESEIIGKTSNELSDSLLSATVHPPEFLDDILHTLRRGETWRGEVCYRTKSGNFIWLLKNAIPMIDNGQFTGFFSFSYDITLKKKQEEEIVEAKRIAEEASETKESFLSIMSHEIRTPLNSVIGLSNILLKRNPREDQLEIVKTLKTSGDNLMYLINNILDYNKIRAGKLELENLPFNLNEQLRLLQFSHHLIALDKGLDFTISITSNTPSQLVGDSMRLNQVLNNLLSNALKFTLKGSVKLSVSLESSNNNHCRLLFVVQDTGIGISEKNLNSLFTPFHQSEKYISRKFGGTGLGLSIVKDLVDLLKGSISVESKEGEGTTFSVSLPFRLSTEVTPLDTTTDFLTPVTVSLDGYRILYVEDVESNQTLVKNFLEDYHVECITASRGDIALLHTSTKNFDVILMDLQMPVMNGYETTKAIQTQNNGNNLNTPIIAFTAESYSESLRTKIIEAGMQELMTKPFRFDHLLEKIIKVCPERTTEDEFFTLQYYEWVFNYDKKKLNEFIEMLIRDFKKFEAEFKNYDSKKDLPKMRSEIHKMGPIVKNLKCITLVELFEQYRKHDEYKVQIKKLNRELTQALQKLFSGLGQLHY